MELRTDLGLKMELGTGSGLEMELRTDVGVKDAVYRKTKAERATGSAEEHR